MKHKAYFQRCRKINNQPFYVIFDEKGKWLVGGF